MASSILSNDIRPKETRYPKMVLNSSLKGDDDIRAVYTRRLRELITANKSLETGVKIHSSLLYERRKKHAKLFCKEDHPKRESLIYFTKSPDLMYCPVPKVGSTFWSRLLEVLRLKNSEIISPFQISNNALPSSYIISRRRTTQNTSNEPLESLLDKSFKFMFSRNPYQRVYSAFVDKLLSPSPYWWSLGKDAIFESRKYGEEATGCGYDVTFKEYIHFVARQKPEVLDEHIRPIALTCDTCQINYDFIGKMETFQQDAVFILNKIQVYGKKVIFKDFDVEYKYDKIVSTVLQTFYFKSWWRKCISVQAGMVRLWRQLQINGLIDMTDTYPFSPEQSHNLTVVEYVNVALEAFRRSSPAAKRTKREAYLQAYSMVEPEDLEQLRKGFLTDFEMFDYEQRPEELFDMDRKRTFEYDYFDVMQLK